jgi:hypothetical protein
MADQKSDRKSNMSDLLAAYEMGLLSAGERAEFEAFLLQDEETQDELFDNAPFVTALKNDPARFRRIAEAALAEMEPSLWERGLTFLSNLMTPRVLAPVTALAVLVVLLTVPQQSVLDLRSLARVEPVPYVQMETRSGHHAADQTFDVAMAHYTAQRYEAAAQGLQETIAVAESAGDWGLLDQAYLYLGLSLLLAEQPAAAIAPLTAATGSVLIPVAERSRWYLAQANLLMNDPIQAQELLQELAAHSPVYGDQATDQLNRLERIVPHH